MSPEERLILKQRVNELQVTAGEGVTAAAIILLGDRLVGVLDGILARLRSIEESLPNIADTP